jgi:hypothetical protein
MNQLNIHALYNIFLISNPNHFYMICTTIQNEQNLIHTIYDFGFA